METHTNPTYLVCFLIKSVGSVYLWRIIGEWGGFTSTLSAQISKDEECCDQADLHSTRGSMR